MEKIKNSICNNKKNNFTFSQWLCMGDVRYNKMKPFNERSELRGCWFFCLLYISNIIYCDQRWFLYI